MNQEARNEKIKCLTFYSKFAFVWGIASLSMSLISSWLLYINWDIFTNGAKGPYPWIGFFGEWLSVGGFYSGLLGLVVSITSIVAKSQKGSRSVNIIVSSLSFLISFAAVWTVPATLDRMREAAREIPSRNLSQLGYTLENYGKEHNCQLPIGITWCDEIIKFDPYSSNKMRKGRVKNDEGLSEFALNINLSELKLNELPKNVVLLFETKLAKNPAGGAELINAENHPLKGCFVLFGDMHVAFVRAEDFNNLRWKP
jgi:hypothetical protein